MELLNCQIKIEIDRSDIGFYVRNDSRHKDVEQNIHLLVSFAYFSILHRHIVYEKYVPVPIFPVRKLCTLCLLPGETPNQGSLSTRMLQ